MMEGRPSIAARQAYNISCQQTEAVTPGRPTVNFFFMCFFFVFCPGLCGAQSDGQSASRTKAAAASSACR